MKKILLLSTIFVASTAFAFGGIGFGGGGGGKSNAYKGGVDAIGIHIERDSKTKPIINIECPEHSTKSDDSPECICDLGYVMTDTECMPKYPAACEESGFYWCATTQSCMKSAEECACPEARQCGETCCGERHTCQDGQCCDAQGNCCDAGDSTGYGTDDGECCEGGTTPAFSWWDDEENYGSFCCTPNKTITKAGDYRVNYSECCDEDSVPYIGDYEIYPEDDYTYFEQYCCPKENSLTHFEGASACCEPGQTAFCSGQKADGTCEYAECMNENDQKYPCSYDYNNDAIGYCTCDKNNTVTPFDKVAACCGEGETPYCSGKDENGNCTWATCCSGTVYPDKGWNGNPLCCNEGSEPYCSARDEDGNCTGWSCCDGTIFTNTTIGDKCTNCSGDALAFCPRGSKGTQCNHTLCRSCDNGLVPYYDLTYYSEYDAAMAQCCSPNKLECIEYNEDGSCSKQFCRQSEDPCTIYCATQIPNEQCSSYNCCDTNKEIKCAKSSDNICLGRACCSHNAQAFCSSFDADNRCSPSCCSEGSSVSCVEKDGDICRKALCCKDGSTPYRKTSIYTNSGPGWDYDCCSGTVSPGTGPNGADECLP